VHINRSNGHLKHATLDGVRIRLTIPSDGLELERLRQLDSHPGLDGVALVAEVDGRLLAAISPGGEAIADPFRRSAEAVELLRLRSRQLDDDRRTSRDGLRRRSRWTSASLSAR
jgi:hypothetical protein